MPGQIYILDGISVWRMGGKDETGNQQDQLESQCNCSKKVSSMREGLHLLVHGSNSSPGKSACHIDGTQ